MLTCEEVASSTLEDYNGMYSILSLAEECQHRSNIYNSVLSEYCQSTVYRALSAEAANSVDIRLYSYIEYI